MSWQKLSHDQLRELVYLCTGAALLLAVAVMLSGNVPAGTANAAAIATYNTGGTYTWTAPSYVTEVWVTVIGGGGGGGGFRWSDGCGGDADTGGGGGSGGAVLNQHVAVTPGNQYAVGVGGGGAGGPYVCGRDYPPSGIAGGTSSFGGLIVATGGSSNSSWTGGAGGTPGGSKGAN